MKLPDEVLIEIAAWLKRYQLDAWLLVSQGLRRVADLRTVNSPRRWLREVKVFDKSISFLPDFGALQTVELNDAGRALQLLDYSCVEEFIVLGADLMSASANKFYSMIRGPAVVRSFSK
ncbi:hypothetical protein AAVH_19500 [Aphelenchoides avenae]|nr:hypothetical protein AAVH_19500 [Aphelenchus avenae]